MSETKKGHFTLVEQMVEGNGVGICEYQDKEFFVIHDAITVDKDGNTLWLPMFTVSECLDLIKANKFDETHKKKLEMIEFVNIVSHYKEDSEKSVKENA